MKPLTSKQVTPEITAWAKSVLNGTLPMGGEISKQFGDLLVTARIEHHTWTYRNGKRVTGNFRGVTLYA